MKTYQFLLVEDNKGDAFLVNERFGELSGYELELKHASRLKEAAEYLRTEDFQAVILDLNLPDSTGIATLHSLRDIRADISYIVLTGLASDDIREQALEAGAQEVIAKDEFSSSQLARSIMLIIEQHQGFLESLRLQNLVVLSPDPMLVIDQNKQIQYMNPAAKALIDADPNAGFHRSLDSALAAGSENEVEISFEHASEQYTAELQLTDIIWKNTTAILATLHDTTSYKRNEDHIRQRNSDLEKRLMLRNAELQGALRRMESLYNFTRTTLSAEDDMFGTIISMAAGTLPCNRVSLIVLDPDRRRVQHMYSGGTGAQFVVTSINHEELMQGLTGWVLRENKSALSPKGQPDPRESSAVRRRRFETNCGSIAVVPIRYQSQVLGTMTAINMPNERDFTQGDLDMLEMMAGQIASTLVRLTLYTSLREANAQLTEQSAQLRQLNKNLRDEINDRNLLEAKILREAKHANSLADLSRILAEIGPHETQILETVARSLVAISGQASVVYRFTNEQTECLSRTYHNNPNTITALNTAFSHTTPNGLFQHTAEQNAAMIWRMNGFGQRNALSATQEHVLQEHGLSVLYVVPLRAQQQVIGVLMLADSVESPVPESELVFLQELADRVGLALDNARLFNEAELARQEAQQASRSKSSFLANISHELRTPMNAIIGFTGTLLMKLPGPINQEQERQLSLIRSSANYLLALINDILDLAKVESGKVTLTLEPINCQELLEQVAASLQGLAEQRGLSFEVVMPKTPLYCLADHRALSQILINLINNAIKFTDEGGVRIELGYAQAHELALHPREIQPNQQWIAFRIIDTGIGIREEDRPRLFHAFERASDTAKTREGTGLGLRLSRLLTELLGGFIDYESTEGAGSTFCLLLQEHTDGSYSRH